MRFPLVSIVVETFTTCVTNRYNPLPLPEQMSPAGGKGQVPGNNAQLCFPSQSSRFRRQTERKGFELTNQPNRLLEYEVNFGFGTLAVLLTNARLA